MFTIPGGPVSWALGFDYFDEKYRNIYDPLTTGGDLLGRAGISGSGERLIKALFGEALVPLMPNLQLSAAVRWDKYDDAAGSELRFLFVGALPAHRLATVAGPPGVRGSAPAA